MTRRGGREEEEEEVEEEEEEEEEEDDEEDEDDEEEEEEDGRVACVRRTGRVISRHPLSRCPISSSIARLISFFL
ncbi:hypothetical protein K0M31_017553 [Melipona bicolor]|uniref:Uncharacterized protein n=1 Tax=Melipona bicolor TaxID=60889 RepID=A0AA40KSK1_9HYME|nr:hypothetical protein K0M31_017553 [Melipona bicolor]